MLNWLSTSSMMSDKPHQGPELSSFAPVTVDEVRRLLTAMSRKSSPLDLIPTSLRKSCGDAFAPIVTRLANLSFNTAIFPSKFKTAMDSMKPTPPTTDRYLTLNHQPDDRTSVSGPVAPKRRLLSKLQPVAICLSEIASNGDGSAEGHERHLRGNRCWSFNTTRRT